MGDRTVVPRNLVPALLRSASHYPVVTVSGPRQSGKTTLCRAIFPQLPYISLERLDLRAAVREDPRGFLRDHPSGALIDEVQHVPEIVSYLQVEVDEDPTPGRFVLTGSRHFGLVEGISQSLAGRTAVHSLLPLSLDEVARFRAPPTDLMTALWTGSYPRIHDQAIPPGEWLSDYVTTYVQRDVRQILNVGDLEAYETFVRLAAGRAAREINLSAIGSDAGVSHNTARSWLSILQTAFLCFRAPVWRTSVRKRVVRAHRLHFFDSGLVCNLLGIDSPDQLRRHPLRGQIFETWVASEIYKARAHAGERPGIYHYREVTGLEIDVLAETSRGLAAVEAKSGATVGGDFFRNLERFSSISPDARLAMVYGGDERMRRRDVDVLGWRDIHAFDWV
ncbi:MAG: ATP-binding protein [Actinomycetota bacterium]